MLNFDITAFLLLYYPAQQALVGVCNATRETRESRSFSCKLSVTPILCVLIQFFNIFFILSLDKKFRSKLCYFLFTDLPECLKYAIARMFPDDTNITNSHKSTVRFH